MATRGICPECKRVVALREHDTALRIHRVGEEIPLLCTGTKPLFGQAFEVDSGDLALVRKSEFQQLKDQVASARIVKRAQEDLIADLEAENLILRTTHAVAVERDQYEAAVDVLLNSGRIGMRQLQVFWEVARGQTPIARLEKVMGSAD